MRVYHGDTRAAREQPESAPPPSPRARCDVHGFICYFFGLRAEVSVLSVDYIVLSVEC